MKRDEAVRIRDRSAAEISKMFSAVETNLHQPNHTMLRLTMFLQFHSAACAHLASTENPYQETVDLSPLAEALEEIAQWRKFRHNPEVPMGAIEGAIRVVLAKGGVP